MIWPGRLEKARCASDLQRPGAEVTVIDSWQGMSARVQDPYLMAKFRHKLLPGGVPCRYTKQADWEYIGQCASSARGLQLIGNGDIMSYSDYAEHMAACPDLATTMLARGALIKPWLFTEVLRFS